MSRFLTVICILAAIALIAAPAFAEVQNVKVSGDISVRMLDRHNYDLDKNDTATTGSNPSNNADVYFMQSMGVNVDADLTDNVSTVVRLIGQRDWNDNHQQDTVSGQAAAVNAPYSGAYNINADLAYVTLKEMVYAPLTLTIGRQDLWFGRGFIIGANLRNPNGAISATEYTEMTSFDAIKATLDLAPWKLDLLYSRLGDKMYTASTQRSTGRIDLFGVNAGYKFDQYKGESEVYYFGKTNKSLTSHTQQVNTYGLRGSLEPIANLTLGAEGAMQRGQYSDATPANQNTARKISAYAYDLFGKYNFENVMWKPTLGLEWISLSGEEDTGKNSVADSEITKKWHGWDAMYRGKIDTSIRDYQNWLYNTRARTGDTSTTWAQDCGLSNQNSLLVTGTVNPIKDVNLKGTYAHFWLNEKIASADKGTQNTSDQVGDEVDLLLTYDYTEDVSFGLLGAIFMPGKLFPADTNDNATDLVGTMKVVF